jgi:protein-disulfide isomerase
MTWRRNMKDMIAKNKRLMLLIIAFSLISVLAACNTPAEDDISKTSGQIASESFFSQDSAQESAESGDSNTVTSQSENTTSGQESTGQAQENQQVSESGSDGKKTNGLDIDSASLEVDISGITVGFTADGHPFRGNPSAPVILEEYSDFQCPFCSRFYTETLSELDQNQIADGDAVLVYYDFPLVNSHPQAEVAANAARCAGEQGSANYWSMHDALFLNPGEWSNRNHEDTFMRYAENIGLELASFNQCLTDFRYESEIRSDLEAGSALGISGTPSFMINDQLLVGAQPVEIFNAAITAIKEGGDLTVTGSQPPPSQPPPSQPSPNVAPTPAVFSGTYAGAMGDPNAPVTIVEFTDYQCPYCSRHSIETMPQIVSDMVDSGRVYYILKDYPLDGIHPDARKASVAARCANEQASYWEMHDAIFVNQAEWAGQGEGAKSLFANYAADLGLDEQSFVSCLDSGRHDLAIEANVEEARSLGITGTPHFFVEGYPLSGARPIDHFVAAVALAEEGRLAEAFTPPVEPTPGPAIIPMENSFAIGDPDAPITIIEYTDFQCPYCSRYFQQTYPQIVEQYVDTGVVRYVFKDFPLTQIHPQAMKASEAARCADDQGAFLEMHDKLFSGQQEWSGKDPVEVFTSYAGQINLDTVEFAECLNSNKHEAAVVADLQEGVSFGVTGTPAFFLNGYALTGAQPFEVFQQAVDTLLQRAEG